MVYIAGDVCFSQDSNYNNKVINSWNSVVNDDDSVLLIGTFVNKDNPASFETLKEIFSQLKGKKQIIDFRRNEEFTEENIIEIMGRKPCSAPGYTRGVIEEQEEFVVIPNLPKFYLRIMNNCYSAAPQSISGLKSIYENKTLSLNIEHWNYAPILYTDIPMLINNMIMFNKMENTEEESNE